MITFHLKWKTFDRKQRRNYKVKDNMHHKEDKWRESMYEVNIRCYTGNCAVTNKASTSRIVGYGAKTIKGLHTAIVLDRKHKKLFMPIIPVVEVTAMERFNARNMKRLELVAIILSVTCQPHVGLSKTRIYPRGTTIFLYACVKTVPLTELTFSFCFQPLSHLAFKCILKKKNLHADKSLRFYQ